MGILTAKQARELAFKDNPRLENFFAWVKQESETFKKTEGNYYPPESFDLTNDERGYLKSLGYCTVWNSACLWYEVYWG